MVASERSGADRSIGAPLAGVRVLGGAPSRGRVRSHADARLGLCRLPAQAARADRLRPRGRAR